MKIEEVPEIHSKVKSLKEETGFTIKMLADETNISESTITRFLSGKSENPNFSKVVALIKTMGGNIDDMIGGKKSSIHITDIDREKESKLISAYEHRIAEIHASNTSQFESMKETYLGVIDSLRIDKKRLFIISSILLCFVLCLLAIDFVIADIGWIRR